MLLVILVVLLILFLAGGFVFTPYVWLAILALAIVYAAVGRRDRV